MLPSTARRWFGSVGCWLRKKRTAINCRGSEQLEAGGTDQGAVVPLIVPCQSPKRCLESHVGSPEDRGTRLRHRADQDPERLGVPPAVDPGPHLDPRNKDEPNKASTEYRHLWWVGVRMWQSYCSRKEKPMALVYHTTIVCDGYPGRCAYLTNLGSGTLRLPVFEKPAR